MRKESIIDEMSKSIENSREHGTIILQPSPLAQRHQLKNISMDPNASVSRSGTGDEHA